MNNTGQDDTSQLDPERIPGSNLHSDNNSQTSNRIRLENLVCVAKSSLSQLENFSLPEARREELDVPDANDCKVDNTNDHLADSEQSACTNILSHQIDNISSSETNHHLTEKHGEHVSVRLKNGNTLIIKFRQQPQRSRMIGFAEKDRRPIDPPPVLELLCLDDEGNCIDCSSFCHDLVACASLYCKDAHFNRSQIRQTRLDSETAEDLRIFNSLEGETDANCQIIFDENGKKSFFFIFPQLSVRIRGEFRLKFVIVNPKEAERREEKQCPIIAQIFSDPFNVYSIKNFPGVTETTKLSSLIRNQGVSVLQRTEIQTHDILLALK